MAAPEVVDFVRRWAATLRKTEAGSAQAETVILNLAREIHAGRERVRLEADDRFAAFRRLCPTSAVLVDPAGLVATVNPAFLRLTASERDLVGTHVVGLGATERARTVLYEAVAELTTGATDRVVQQLEINAGDRRRLVELTATILPGDTRYLALMFEDLHDPLTGLPDAAHFRSRLASIASGRVAVLFLDLDGFRAVSNGLGAEVADQVLRGVAGTLREVFDGDEMFLARLFGDGFAVALHGDLSTAAVVKLAQQAIDALGTPMYVEGNGIGLSASVGIAIGDLPGAGHTQLMQSAEVALKRAKDLGKAQWVLFDPKVGNADRDRYRLACALAGALESGQLSVTYQPHVVLPDAQIVTSVNAALCWDHPTRGRLRAHEFYPLAEITGMTVQLGRHLLSEALRTTAEWRTRFRRDAPMVCLTLPRRMAIDTDLVGIVRAELDRHGLEPRHLMLCVDGPSLLDRRGDLVESIGQLAGLGVTFILYVTGLPELELVPALHVPAPAVMLTGQIVDELGGSQPPRWARRNVRQLVARAEELGVKVGADGVRSEAQARLLFELGVVVASGTYLPEHITREDAQIWVGRAYPMG